MNILLTLTAVLPYIILIIYLHVESWLYTVSIYENVHYSFLKNRNGDAGDKNNYRPIANVTAMSKLFELCLS